MVERRKPGDRTPLGEILVARGLITKGDLAQALRVQVGGMRRLGHILIRMRRITDENLTQALSEQLGLPVVDLAAEFRAGAEGLLPRFLCHKYGVIPLALEENNVLRLAMADPLDDQAISDVESYTGRVVQPALARLSEIERAIPRRVAFSRHDLFNPLLYRSVARVAAVVAALLLLVTGVLAYRMAREERYGSVSRVGDSLIYKNRDLMIDQGRDGSVYFSGRGAHAEGYYGIRFENPRLLGAFVKSAASQLSTEQREWVDWVLAKKLKEPPAAIAAR
jgi:hypothetical protein